MGTKKFVVETVHILLYCEVKWVNRFYFLFATAGTLAWRLLSCIAVPFSWSDRLIFARKGIERVMGVADPTIFLYWLRRLCCRLLSLSMLLGWRKSRIWFFA